MTGCRGLKAVLFTLGIWSSILNAEKIDDEVSLEYGSPKSLESQKYIYSWTGPNALARSALLERQERLQYNCEEVLKRYTLENETLSPESFRNILVDEQHELLYCYVPKVACTNWKRVLMIATGKWPGNDPLEIPADQAHSPGVFQRLSNYTLSEIEKKLVTYDKLIVVRHPFERLLSAYRNKFEAKHEKSSRYFQTRFGRKIIKKYRANATQESLQNGDDVTFREFVEFITDDTENGTRNEHWRPIYELCQPCIVNYNLVSKYETLVEDATEVLERMNVVSVSFPSKSPSGEPTSKKLDRYYSTLSYKQLRKLEDLYKLDMKLFDYSLEDVLGFSWLRILQRRWWNWNYQSWSRDYTGKVRAIEDWWGGNARRRGSWRNFGITYGSFAQCPIQSTIGRKHAWNEKLLDSFSIKTFDNTRCSETRGIITRKINHRLILLKKNFECSVNEKETLKMPQAAHETKNILTTYLILILLLISLWLLYSGIY